jgi:hypothetical protein
MSLSIDDGEIRGSTAQLASSGLPCLLLALHAAEDVLSSLSAPSQPKNEQFAHVTCQLGHPVVFFGYTRIC